VKHSTIGQAVQCALALLCTHIICLWPKLSCWLWYIQLDIKIVIIIFLGLCLGDMRSLLLMRLLLWCGILMLLLLLLMCLLLQCTWLTCNQRYLVLQL